MGALSLNISGLRSYLQYSRNLLLNRPHTWSREAEPPDPRHPHPWLIGLKQITFEIRGK